MSELNYASALAALDDDVKHGFSYSYYFAHCFCCLYFIFGGKDKSFWR